MGKAEGNLQYLGLIGMHNPFLLQGMHKALDRIAKAINNREKIVLYGYYDVDSIMGISIIMLVLKYLNADVEYFIPDEYRESFEIDINHVNNSIKYFGADLLVTIGCGTNSKDGINLCKKLGIDVIVVDYHKQYQKLDDIILINPNQKGCKYPFKELIGSGLTFKLCEAISTYYEIKCINKYMDLAAIGIVSKLKNVYGENEVILNEGLNRMITTNNHGINALIELKKLEKINIETALLIASSVEPTINAVGRMDNARIAVELFTTKDSYRALQIGKYLNNEVNGRQNILRTY